MFVRITWDHYRYLPAPKVDSHLKIACSGTPDGFGLCGYGIENMTQAEFAKPLSH